MNAKETIEHQVNTVYQTSKQATLSISDPEICDINLQVSEINGTLIFLNEIETSGKELYFDLERKDALVMMYFQLNGSTHFVDEVPFTVPAGHHSLNYLPSFQSKCYAEKNSHIKNLCIKINPGIILNEWPEDSTTNSWFRSIEDNTPLVTLHESRVINHRISFNLRQLTDCPYSGELGNSFRQSIIQVLLIQQLAEFMPLNKAAATCCSQKLSSKDIAALHDLKQYLEVNFLTDVSLDKLARRAGLNSFKLKYGFRLLFNTPVMKYIDELKLMHARQLIMDNHDTDRFDIADLLGYNHYSNFSAAFKRYFGKPPSAYKKYASHTD